jgi:hypothetical protein
MDIKNSTKSQRMAALAAGAMLAQLLVIRLDAAMQVEGVYTNILHQSVKDLGDTATVLEHLEKMAVKMEAEETSKPAIDATPAPFTIN